MVRVEFMGPIDMEPREFKARSLLELRELLHAIPEVSNWLEDSAIAINDEIATSLQHPLKEGDRVVILPPVCGG